MTNPPPDAVVLTTRGNPNPHLARKKMASAKRAFRQAVSTERLQNIIENMLTIAEGKDPETDLRFDPKASVAAANFVFDRMFGKAPITMNFNSTQTKKIEIDIEDFRSKVVAALTGRAGSGLIGKDDSPERLHSGDSDHSAGEIPRLADR